MTPKQKAFVAEYLKDKNATQAAIRAGYKADNADVTGPRLLGNVGIADAIRKAQERVATRVEMTVASHLAKLEELRDAAISAGQLNAAIRAEELRGKVTGLYTERVEHSGSVTLSNEERERTVLGLLRQAKQRRERGLVS